MYIRCNGEVNTNTLYIWINGEKDGFTLYIWSNGMEVHNRESSIKETEREMNLDKDKC